VEPGRADQLQLKGFAGACSCCSGAIAPNHRACRQFRNDLPGYCTKLMMHADLRAEEWTTLRPLAALAATRPVAAPQKNLAPGDCTSVLTQSLARLVSVFLCVF
jgi:hypothetical protein